MSGLYVIGNLTGNKLICVAATIPIPEIIFYRKKGTSRKDNRAVGNIESRKIFKTCPPFNLILSCQLWPDETVFIPLISQVKEPSISKRVHYFKTNLKNE